MPRLYVIIRFFLFPAIFSALAAPGSAADEDLTGAFSPKNAVLEQMQARGFLATGLEAVYPEDAECLKINSDFGSSTRGDGSMRSRMFYNGYHGGADIPAPLGTPVLAMAAGKVVHKSEGVSIGGIAMILQHAPEDTGLPLWTYTEYKHLRELPAAPLGHRFAMGEVIAYSGDTGTKGGYYGAAGHSHLHLSAFNSPNDQYTVQTIFMPAGGQWMDPLALFKGPPLKSDEIRELPGAAKRVRFAYMTPNGALAPPGAKVIWPFACIML